MLVSWAKCLFQRKWEKTSCSWTQHPHTEPRPLNATSLAGQTAAAVLYQQRKIRAGKRASRRLCLPSSNTIPVSMLTDTGTICDFCQWFREAVRVKLCAANQCRRWRDTNVWDAWRLLHPLSGKQEEESLSIALEIVLSLDLWVLKTATPFLRSGQSPKCPRQACDSTEGSTTCHLVELFTATVCLNDSLFLVVGFSWYLLIGKAQ